MSQTPAKCHARTHADFPWSRKLNAFRRCRFAKCPVVSKDISMPSPAAPLLGLTAAAIIASINKSERSGRPDAMRERKMICKHALYLSASAVVLAAFVTMAPTQVRAQATAVTIDADDIGGVVT